MKVETPDVFYHERRDAMLEPLRKARAAMREERRELVEALREARKYIAIEVGDPRPLLGRIDALLSKEEP